MKIHPFADTPQYKQMRAVGGREGNGLGTVPCSVPEMETEKPVRRLRPAQARTKAGGKPF